ncbi:MULTISPECIES: DUF1992 domain-containing protein [Paenibacillus]|uniref:DUF1992 domain-containing protein n=1 Tax=Paenibacillus TaxID=44249 RepID=UPI0022B8F6C4|nr:DUF1992 domain-containing protein [Paenibacillus caseinilyticus]MCZ8524009.1 DUF1992 domain-containing protein [Paenibacillus caseinilyticus]
MRSREQDERRRHGHQGEQEAAERPIIPLPKETLEDRDVILHAQMEQHRLASDAYEEFVKNGGLEKLPGLGKPLEVPTGDILSSIMLQAKIQPPFLMLRTEIRKHMELALELLKQDPGSPEIDASLDDANKQITELNYQAPSLSLHRRKLTRENLREQYDRWYK